MNLVIQSPAPLSADHHKTLVALARGSRATMIDANALRIADANLAQRADLEVYCGTHQLDYAFIEPGRQLRDFGLVAMDMDSTLITIECIDEIADFCGLESGSGRDHRSGDARRDQGFQRKPDAPRGAAQGA